MQRNTAAWMPVAVIAGSVLLGGWFLQEGAARDANVYSQVRTFQEVVDYVSSSYVDPIPEEELYDSAIDGLIDQLGDPNSSYIPASDVQNFSINTTDPQYGGVGLEVLERDGFVTVISPMPGGPGIRAGIRAGDQFWSIDGELAEGWPVDRAVDELRGRPGESVDVEMLRPGVDEPIPFTLTREVIRVRSVPFSLRLEGDVGYVPLQLFRATSSDEVRAAVDSLNADGLRGLILDMRSNPGGLLDEGIEVSELFLNPGDRVVETRGRAPGQTETISARREQAWPDLPVVVLIDEMSASASEIVAGALQDHDRALVIGAPSYGKGSVQSLYRVTGGGILRLTTAHWYTPVGRSIEKRREDFEEVLPNGALSLQGALVQTDEVLERPVFESMGGRTLYGGGGITPDRWILADTLTSAETRAVNALFRQAGLFTSGVFNFAVEYVRDTPGLSRDFEVDDAMLDQLHAYLRDRGLETSQETLDAAERFVRVRLEREIALQAFGEAGEAEHLFRYDTQLQDALRILRQVETTDALFEAAGITDAEEGVIPVPIDGAGSDPRP